MIENPTRRTVLATLGSSAVVLGGSSAVAAHGGGDDHGSEQPTGQDAIAEVRQATAKYQDVDRARADGYVEVSHCETNPNGEGAMGIHFLKPPLRGDGEVTATEPEVLLYEPTRDGGYDLVGVEYMANVADYDGHPELFGRKFDGPMPAHSPQGEEHYDLHLWCWRANPNGMFAPFNPNVSCPDHE